MEGALIARRFLLGPVIRESAPVVVYATQGPAGAAWLKLPRGPEHAEAIRSEATLAKAIGEHALDVLEEGVTDDGLPFLVLEPVTGERLDHWRSAHGGRAPPDETMGLGDELCRAIGRVHDAGFVIGLLRADAVIVLPSGGIRLLELEHAKSATPSGIREDALRVGRVLYEMLSGVPFIGEAKPLVEIAPELPQAITSVVDDAARGGFDSLAALRTALDVARPEWLGPIRKPMSTIPPEAAAYHFSDMPLSLPGQKLFDPRSLADDSSRRLLASPKAPNVDASPTWMQRLSQHEIAPEDDASGAPLPAAPVNVSEAPVVPRERSRMPVVIGVVGVAAIGLVIALRGGGSQEPVRPAPVSASSAATEAPSVPATAAVTTPSPTVIATPSATSLAATATAPSASASTVTSASDAGTTTLLRFEGSLSPRLVIVDGAVLGITTNKEVRSPCGRHAVKITAKGTPRWLDLRCESEQVIKIENNGNWTAAE